MSFRSTNESCRTSFVHVQELQMNIFKVHQGWLTIALPPPWHRGTLFTRPVSAEWNITMYSCDLSLVHKVENVVVRHPSRGDPWRRQQRSIGTEWKWRSVSDRGDLLCFVQGNSNYRRRQTMCSRQCFHWHMCFRIGRFRFPKRKCGDESRRQDQSRARLFPSMSTVFEVNGFEEALSKIDLKAECNSSSISPMKSKCPVGKARVCCFPRLNLSSVTADGASAFFLWQKRSADDIRASDALLSHWNLLSAFCSSLGRWDRWWSGQFSPSPAASFDTSVLLLHAISGHLSPSEILDTEFLHSRLR